MAVVETRNLVYDYSQGTPFELRALDGVSLSIEEGDFLGIIGPTGSGKSTLVQHLNGILRPQAGQVLLEGKDIWEEPAKIRRVRFQVGMMFQYPEYQLFEETVYKDIAFGPKNMGLDEDEIEKRVREAASFVGLPASTLEKSPYHLSGGEMRRAAIAGIVAMRPKVIVLDEPAAGLDPYGREAIMGQIRDYAKETNTTVVIVSHSMEEITRWTKRVMVMDKGKALMTGPTEEIFSQAGKLEEIGLSIPQISKVFMKLSARGIDIPANVFTVEQAEREILRLLAKKS